MDSIYSEYMNALPESVRYDMLYRYAGDLNYKNEYNYWTTGATEGTAVKPYKEYENKKGENEVTQSYNFTISNITMGEYGFYHKKDIKPKVKRLIFELDSKTTVVLWEDNTKTIVKCSPDEEFVPEFGFAMALAKKMYGSRNKFLDVVAKSVDDAMKKSKYKSNKK